MKNHGLLLLLPQRAKKSDENVKQTNYGWPWAEYDKEAGNEVVRWEKRGASADLHVKSGCARTDQASQVGSYGAACMSYRLTACGSIEWFECAYNFLNEASSISFTNMEFRIAPDQHLSVLPFSI